MIVGLLAAGAVLCVSGLIAIGFGIPIKEFSFGNTMILTGATLLGSGIVVVALAMVATELRKLSDALQGKRRATAVNRGRQLNIPPGLFPDPPGGGTPAAGDAQAAWPPDTASPGAPDETAPDAGSPAMPPLRGPFVPEPIPEPRSFDTAWSGPPGSAPAPPPINPMRQAPAAGAASAPEPAPQRRSDLFRRSARASSLSGNPPPEETRPPPGSPGKSDPPAPSSAPPAAPPNPAVTILKSGVVDGMAYTLYSDGSIEAELAGGKVRFASIEALRAHLDQRGNN